MKLDLIPTPVADCLPADAWIVGGAIRDCVLGREVVDVDLVVDRDPEEPARAFAARVGRTAVFPLSEEFGAWRAVHHDDRWQVDFSPMHGGSIEADLGRRDLTINAVAAPASGGDPVDPYGGLQDLEARRVRAVSGESFELDPLRVLRVARFAVELEFEVENETIELAARSASRIRTVSGERQFLELRRIVASDTPQAGLELLERMEALAAVLPELPDLRGVVQSDYHHLDVYDHTMLVLHEVVHMESDPARLGPAARRATELLSGELADGIDRWTAIRFAALFHDIAKPATRTIFRDGRVGFPGHDELGAQVTREALSRFNPSTKLIGSISSMVRHHLDAGFLTHKMPIDRRALHAYLTDCAPVATDVTVLSIADRLATRGKGSLKAVERHLDLTSRLLEESVDLELRGPPPPLVRGDELAAELGIDQGPRIGELLAELAVAQFAGEVVSREGAIAHARSTLAAG